MHRFQALCLPGEMVGAAEGRVEAAPEPALGLACGSPVGRRFLLDMRVIRVSLRASGKSMCMKERSMGELCVVEFVVCMKSWLGQGDQWALLPVSSQTRQL